jgi:hypothetical protein
MPLGVAICFGPGVLLWWLASRKSESNEPGDGAAH